MTKNISIPFRMVNIETREFAIIENNYVPSQEENFLQIQVNYSVSKESNVIGVIVKIVLEHNERQPYVIVSCSISFEVESATMSKMWDAEVLTLPKNFITHLLVLTIGAIRGVLHAKTEQSIIGKQMLPEVNVTEIIKQDEVIDIKNMTLHSAQNFEIN
jgi:hypothetical protein